MNSDILLGERHAVLEDAYDPPVSTSYKEELLAKLKGKVAKIAVIGLGYVGLPLAVSAALEDYDVLGFDVDAKKIKLLKEEISYIEAVDDESLQKVVENGQFSCTKDFSELSQCDVIVICVPTPLTAHREPDLSYVEKTAKEISKYIQPGTLVVLESTTYPGTTHEVLVPLLEKSDLKVKEDIFVGFSPEREDPGNKDFSNTQIPKIVAGECKNSAELVEAFYGGFFERVVPVSSTQTAEAVKITENIFRSVNIALVNELKVIYDAMGVDVWEVIQGAATKPFGFMPFYPGPGVGGHCIPIDPFYLTWKVREYDLVTRFIALAGEINANMPRYVIYRTRHVLDRVLGKGMKNSKVLVSGVAYKKNISDVRDSPALKILEMLIEQEADVCYFDPYVSVMPNIDQHESLAGLKSIQAEDITAENFDVILISTDHDGVDYEAMVKLGIPIVDTRNIIAKNGLPMDNVTKA